MNDQRGKTCPPEKRAFSRDRELAKRAGRLGGLAMPKAARSFVVNPELAREAGAKGGLAVPKQLRGFSLNRERAREAGRKGGLKSQDRKRRDRFIEKQIENLDHILKGYL
jgi:general stress protein YciG